MKKLTLFGVILTVVLGVMLWQQQETVTVKAAPVALINVPAGDVSGLINAIITANTNPGPDTISLGNGTYTFATPHNWEYGPNALPPITSDITIDGNGAVLDSTETVRLRFFYVSGGLSFVQPSGPGLPAGKLTLHDLTLRNGKQKGGDSYRGGGGAGMGGAIFNQGELTLERVTLTENRAAGGDGVVNLTLAGGGGMGQDSQGSNGGGFGGAPLGVGGAGGISAAGQVNGGGGGGFLPSANGGSGATGGTGGGSGLLGGDGGNSHINGGTGAGGIKGDGGGGGTWVSTATANGNGGSYGAGGTSGNVAGTNGGGGGVGGGGASGGGNGGGGGFGGGGGLGNDGGPGHGDGGFGGGGSGGGMGGFGGGNGLALGGAGGGIGGAIFNHRGTLTIINSTLTANTAQGGKGGDGCCSRGGNGGSGYGGAVFNLNGTVKLTNSTLAANTVIAGAGGDGLSTDGTPGQADGGALYNLAYGNKIEDGTASTATVTLSNTILATSIGGTSDLVNDRRAGTNPNTATVTYTGPNLVMTSTSINGATAAGSPTQTGNPQLDPLVNNGGLTPTMALQGTSTAINAGSNALALDANNLALTTDQRGPGFDRISSVIVDLGAFEVLNTAPTITGASISRTQGATGPVSTIATVDDDEEAPGSLTVTVSNPAPGITVTGITNTNGAITANVAVACNATPGNHFVTLQVEDSGNMVATTDLIIDVSAITLPSLPGGTAGTPYNQSAAASPAGSYTYAVTGGALPSGLTLNTATGALTGTPDVANTFNFQITATSAEGNCPVVRSYSLVITCPAISLSPLTLPAGALNTNYNQAITAAPAGTTYTFAITSGALPLGVTLSAAGVLTGAPTESGAFGFRVTASGFGTCAGSRDYSLFIACPAITVNPASLPGGTLGVLYSQSISASPVGIYSFAVVSGSLPTGLSLNPGTGALTGTPTLAGFYSFGIRATSGGCSATRNYTIAVNCAATSITTMSLPAGTVGVNYSQTVNVTPAGSYTFSLLSGALPSGITLNSSTGVISGQSQVAGTSNFTIKAQSASGCIATQALSLTMNCPTVTLNPASLPGGQIGTVYSQAITPSPAGPYTYSFTGSLPPGLGLNAISGILSGTPTANGTFSFVVTANSAAGCSVSKPYSVTITPGACPVITLSSLPGGSAKSYYINHATASPAGLYSYSVTGTLPPGLTLVGASGLIYGLPAAGTYNFSVTATNVNNCTGTRAYSLTIAP